MIRDLIEWLGRLFWPLLVFLLLLLSYELYPAVPQARPARVDGWQLSQDVSLDSEFRNLTAQYFDGSTLIATEHKEVYASEDQGDTWQWRGRLGSPEPSFWARLRSRLGSTRSARAILRPQGIETLLVLESGTLLASAPPFIYRSETAGHSWEIVHRFRQRPDRKGVLRHWDQDQSGAVWYGEYGPGRGGSESRILRGTNDGTRWEEAFIFPPRGQPGGVRHVHGVQVDPYRGRVWVTTGDRDEEVRLGWLEGDTSRGWQFRPISLGGQEWKAASLMFTAGHVYWATDAPRGPMGIYRWDRQDDVTEQVAELYGPVLFSTQLADGSMVVATEVEGLGSDAIALWSSVDGESWEQEILAPTFRSARRRKYGTFSFPLGRPMDRLVLNAARVGEMERSVVVGSLEH